MIIHDFTTPELDYLRSKCNFTDMELAVFERRARNMTIGCIAEELGYSPDHVKKISQRVNRKIIRVI